MTKYFLTIELVRENICHEKEIVWHIWKANICDEAGIKLIGIEFGVSCQPLSSKHLDLYWTHQVFIVCKWNLSHFKDVKPILSNSQMGIMREMVEIQSFKSSELKANSQAIPFEGNLVYIHLLCG